MKIIISPAKSLDFESNAKTDVFTQPSFLKESSLLNKKLKNLSKKKLIDLMKISPALADLNYERNQKWQQPFSLENSKQAIYAFTGEVFKGIDVKSLAEEKLPLLQNRLRILSGLYGLLKPLDLIQPYRLEMGTRINVGKTNNLYKFWDSSLADSLNNEMEEGDLLINLASTEYFKAVPKKVLKNLMITPTFKEFKNGDYKIVMTYAKRARGLMVRYIIENNINTLEDLKGFHTEGYAYTESLSSGNELVFTR
tara:strand:+ start:7273 stop:8031 length:759 start_codon:yes stop_codon:yes gene_type:complete